MNRITIDFKRIKTNIQRNAILSILIIMACALIGVICGINQRNTYEAKQEPIYSGEQEVSFDAVQKDGSYYFDAFNSIKSEFDVLDLYFEYFQKVGLSQAKKEKLDKVKESFNEYYKEYQQAEYFFWNKPMSIVTIAETREFYEYKAKELKEKKDIIEKEYLEGKESGSLTEEDKQIMEKKLANADLYIKRLENLNSLLSNATPKEIDDNNAKADDYLNKRRVELNAIIAEFNIVMKEISETDNYAIMFNKHQFTDQEEAFGLLKLSDRETLLTEQLSEALIYAKSIEGLDDGKERMYAMISFFILFGIIISVTVGAFYEPKDNKEGQKNAI